MPRNTQGSLFLSEAVDMYSKFSDEYEKAVGAIKNMSVMAKKISPNKKEDTKQLTDLLYSMIISLSREIE